MLYPDDKWLHVANPPLPVPEPRCVHGELGPLPKPAWDLCLCIVGPNKYLLNE